MAEGTAANWLRKSARLPRAAIGVVHLYAVSGYRDVADSEKTPEAAETNLLSSALPGFVKENYRKIAVFLSAFYRKIAECLAFSSSQPLLTKLTSITETNRAAYGAGSLI